MWKCSALWLKRAADFSMVRVSSSLGPHATTASLTGSKVSTWLTPGNVLPLAYLQNNSRTLVSRWTVVKLEKGWWNARIVVVCSLLSHSEYLRRRAGTWKTRFFLTCTKSGGKKTSQVQTILHVTDGYKLNSQPRFKATHPTYEPTPQSSSFHKHQGAVSNRGSSVWQTLTYTWQDKKHKLWFWYMKHSLL